VHPEPATLELVGLAAEDVDGFEEEVNKVFRRELERFR
jgi:hypothetical protein